MVRVGGTDPLPVYPDDAKVETAQAAEETQATEATEAVGENASGREAEVERPRPTGPTLPKGDSWEKTIFQLKIGQVPSGTSSGPQQGVSKLQSQADPAYTDAVRDGIKLADGGGQRLADSSPASPRFSGPPIGPKPTGPKGPQDHGIPDAGVPPATTKTEKAADLIMGKIHDKVAAGLKSTVDFNRHPQLSSEQEALVDFTTGVNQYKEYMDYAKTAIDLLKLYPNNSEIKQRLTQVMGKLEELGKHLGTVSAVLGKVEKYAGIVKDAMGIATEAGNLVKNFKNMSLEKFAESFSKLNANAQGLLGTARDTLISLGLKGGSAAATGGLVLGGLGAYLNLADDALQAGLKNVKAYIAHEQKAIREGETGIKERSPEPPKLPPPPEFETVAGKRLYESLDNLGQVHNAVHNEFETERAPIKAKFDADKEKAHANFDHDEFPQIYKQHRREIERDLQGQIDFLSREGPRTPADWEKIRLLNETLQTMKDHDRTGPSAADLSSELKNFPGLPWAGSKGTTTVSLHGAEFPREITAKLESLYNNGLINRYERDHLDDAGLQNRYAEKGLGSQQERKVEERLDRELKLVDDKGGIIF